MTNDLSWTPPYTWEERFKYAVIPPGLYIRHLVRKNLRKGEPELRLLPELVSRQGIAVDVGANKGVYTALLSKLVRRVVAFEPNPKIYRILKRALPNNAEAHNIALSDINGRAQLLVPKKKGGYSNQWATLNSRAVADDHGIVQVATRTLDSFCLKDVGFIKIDVEGHEQEVLEGAKDTIKRWRPTLLLELEERHTGIPIQEMLDGVCSLGYEGLFLDRGRLLSISSFDAGRNHRSPTKPIEYVNNFVFLPKQF